LDQKDRARVLICISNIQDHNGCTLRFTMRNKLPTATVIN